MDYFIMYPYFKQNLALLQLITALQVSHYNFGRQICNS